MVVLKVVSINEIKYYKFKVMIKELENKVRIKEWIKLLFGADGVETGASESINEG